MTKDNATKRPWRVIKSNQWQYITCGSLAIKDIVATVEANGDDEESNAKLIVKAVNCHNELVEALKECKRQLTDNREYIHRMTGKPLKEYSAERQAKQALSKSESDQ